ncbi:hypothetical protein ACFL3F_04285 [Planctomycetota bacterium]
MRFPSPPSAGNHFHPQRAYAIVIEDLNCPTAFSKSAELSYIKVQDVMTNGTAKFDVLWSSNVLKFAEITDPTYVTAEVVGKEFEVPTLEKCQQYNLVQEMGFGQTSPRGIGRPLAGAALPHHRTCGSASGGSADQGRTETEFKQSE